MQDSSRSSHPGCKTVPGRLTQDAGQFQVGREGHAGQEVDADGRPGGRGDQTKASTQRRHDARQDYAGLAAYAEICLLLMFIIIIYYYLFITCLLICSLLMKDRYYNR